MTREPGPSRHDLPRLPVGEYRLIFEPSRPLAGEGFLGSAWRGGFGHALRAAVCVTGQRECRGCMLYRGCTYPYVFETPPPPESQKMRRYTAAPHPFLFVVPLAGMEVAEDGCVGLGVNLLGEATRTLAHVLFSLRRAGEAGIGPRRTRFRLLRVEQRCAQGLRSVYQEGGGLEPVPVTVPEPPPVPASVRVHVETPLRLKRDGRIIDAHELRFSDLFGSLLRRISMLTYFHTDTPLETDFRGITRLARAVEFQGVDLRWHDWSRYSSRQERAVPMGGVIGSIDLDGQDLQPFWPFLWLGQWTHAGRGASMGLGRLRLEPMASLPQAP